MDETRYVRHLTKEAAEKHASELERDGFDSEVTQDGDRWLVTARRDDGLDDAFTIARLETFGRDP